MRKSLVVGLFLGWLAATVGVASASAAPIQRGWGKVDGGAQIGIYFVTNLFSVPWDSIPHLLAEVRNASTNILLLELKRTAWRCTIKDAGGNARNLTPTFPYYNAHVPDVKALHPGETMFIGAADFFGFQPGTSPGDYDFGPVTNGFLIATASGLKPGVRVPPGALDFERLTNTYIVLSTKFCPLVSNPLKLRVVPAGQTSREPPEIVDRSVSDDAAREAALNEATRRPFRFGGD